jgi:hypothetical protein
MSGYLSLLSALRQRAWIDLRPLKRALFGADGPPLPYPLTGLVFILGALSIVAAIAARSAFRVLRTREAAGLSSVFMALTVLYVAVLGNALEYGENNRFRVATDPLIYLLVVVACRDMGARAMRKWRGRSARDNIEGALNQHGES